MIYYVHQFYEDHYKKYQCYLCCFDLDFLCELATHESCVLVECRKYVIQIIKTLSSLNGFFNSCNTNRLKHAFILYFLITALVHDMYYFIVSTFDQSILQKLKSKYLTSKSFAILFPILHFIDQFP